MKADKHADRVLPARGDPSRRGRVVLCGAGNIGSHAAIDLAIRGALAALCVVDRDTVEEHNCLNQFYDRRDVGKAKAEVTADRLRRLAPQLEVEAIVADVEDLPLGVIAEADVCLGAFDSLRARQVMANECAYRLGVPVVDGAVDGAGGWFGTVQIFVGGAACLECKWDASFYRQLAGEMPCGGRGSGNLQSNRAAALLGAAVASVMTDKTLRVLDGGGALDSHEVAIDLHVGRRLESRLRRANGCRFDHQVARQTIGLGRPFDDLTLDDVSDAALDWADGERVQLEFRRKLFGRGPLEPDRWQTPESLRRFAVRSLRDIGLTTRNRAWMRTPSRSAFLAFG